MSDPLFVQVLHIEISVAGEITGNDSLKPYMVFTSVHVWGFSLSAAFRLDVDLIGR